MGRRQRSRDRVRAERVTPKSARVPDAPASESESTPLPLPVEAPEAASEGRVSGATADTPMSNDDPWTQSSAVLVHPHSSEPSLPAELPPAAELEPGELELTDELELSTELEVPPEPELASEREPPPSPALETREALDRADATAAVDAEIAAAIAEGDTRRALELCAELHGESVGRLCLALLGSQTEADAVTEEVLLEAYRRPAEFGAQSSLRGWLLGLARRACVRRLERRPAKRRNGTDDTPPSSERAVGARARQARALLTRVRPSEREALVLRFVADASTEDVAAACDIEPAEAQRRVSRALARLREALENETSDD